MHRTACLLLLPLILVACETAETTKPKHLSSSRGLTEKPAAFGNKVLVKEADPRTAAKYKKVIVENVRVVQTKDTKANEKTSASKQESQELAKRFQEILRNELSSHYQVTSRRGRDTLVVRATLTDLQASKPGVFVFNYLPYAAAVTTGLSLATGETLGAGSTTVEVEVLDSYSRRQVYALVDQFKGSKFQPGGIERWGQTEAAMKSWARQVRAGLQGVKPNQLASSSTSKPAASGTTRTAAKPASAPAPAAAKKGLFGGAGAPTKKS
jgi:hypothetical protein